MSMRWRLIGSFGLVILIALGTVAAVTRYTTEQEVQTFFRHGGQMAVENLVDSLEYYYEQNGSWQNVDEVFRTGAGRGRGPRSGISNASEDHILVDQAGIVQYSLEQTELGNKLSNADLSSAISLEVSNTVVGYLLPEGGIPELPDNFEALLLERVNRASLLAALISGGLAVLLALILSAIILKPVRSLTAAAKNMAAGDLSQRVSIPDKGELSMLGEAFNQMSQSLQDAETRRQSLTADIAHELRNPLAIQRAHIEALQDGLYPLDQDNLKLIAAQNHQLTGLVNELRTLALADAGELVLNKRPINLVKVCRETAARFEPQAKSKNIQIIEQCDSETLIVEADKERLQQIHDNIMQNGLRYTPEGGAITLSLHRQEHRAVFEIHNSGPHISEEAMAHLFERFYRGEKARDRASGGTGLGLAIARKLAEGHGGTLSCENHPEGGVVFRLTLPV